MSQSVLPFVVQERLHSAYVETGMVDPPSVSALAAESEQAKIALCTNEDDPYVCKHVPDHHVTLHHSEYVKDCEPLTERQVGFTLLVARVSLGFCVCQGSFREQHG